MATFLIALLGGVVGLIGGFFAGAFIDMAIAVATHMSTFEGAAGYFAVFLCGPIGGIFGLVLGVWLALRRCGGPKSFFALLAYSGLSLGAIVAVSAGVIMLLLFFDETLNRNAAKPQALVEIRLPPGTKLPDNLRGIEVELNTDKASASAYFDKESHSDGDGR
jgi:hypothetical protein